jgi:hypothetical protein
MWGHQLSRAGCLPRECAAGPVPLVLDLHIALPVSEVALTLVLMDTDITRMT